MQEYKFKAKLSYYLFWFVIIGIFSIPFFLVYLKNPTYIEMLIIPFSLLVFTFIYINCFSIKIKNGKIIYNKFFSRKKEVGIKNIEEIQVLISNNYIRSMEFTRTTFEFLITRNDNLSRTLIDLKKLSYEDIEYLLKIIIDENKNIKLDKMANALIKGDFEIVKKKRWENLFYFIIISIFVSLVSILISYIFG